MQSWSALFALSVAMSLDGLAAGFSYGLKGTKLNRLPLIIVAGTSAILLAMSLGVGNQIRMWLSPWVGQAVGGLLLVSLGVAEIGEAFGRRFDEKHELQAGDEPAAVWQVRLKRMGLVVQVLRDPNQADVDRSGVISGQEALILGAALGLDAAGVGLGLGITGLDFWWFPLIVAGVNLLFITIGKVAGTVSRREAYPGYLVYLPGMLLALVGVCMII